MNISVRMVLVLGVIGLVSGASLALVYRWTTPVIEKNRERALEEAVYNVVPGAARFEPVEIPGRPVFEVSGRGGALLGYAFIAEGNGYQGKISIMCGANRDLAGLSGIEILESVETPGLGGEIATEEFRSQFRGLETLPGIKCVKGEKTAENEIEAVTGATISSQSVTNIINDRLKELRGVLVEQ